MTHKIILGLSGEPGSFSEQVALLYAEREGLPVHLVYLLDMEGVLAAIAAGEIERGIFPVVNLHGGLVSMAFTAMGKYLFKPIDEYWLDVHHCLLVKPGMRREQINKIVSHSQAFAQCKNHLNKHFHGLELMDWQDTAKAAQDLAEGKLDTYCAVIAPKRAAHLYGLEIIAEDIQDHQPNLTVFLVVEK